MDVHSHVFPDLFSFIAGQLQAHPGVWDWIAESSSYPFRSTVLYLVKSKVDVHDYFRHFKWESFDSDLPSPRVFRNHPSCEPFAELISQSIKQRLATGVISVWGRVWECKPPHPVLPLRVEPTNQGFAMIIGFWTYGCRIHHSPLITCTSYRFVMINTPTRPCAMTSRDIIVIIIIV